MGGIYRCDYQEVSVSSGCGCKEVYRFPHITYPLLLLYLLFFAAASLLKNIYILYILGRFCTAVRLVWGSLRLAPYIYIFQVDCHSVNVFNVSMCI